MGKKIFWAFAGGCAALVMLLFVGGIVGNSSNTTDSQPSTRNQTPSDASEGEPQQTPQTPPLQISAISLNAAYDANEVAADNQFAGKRLEVSGYVASIDKGALGGIHVRLIAGMDEGLDDVDASMNPGNEDEAAKLMKLEPVNMICGSVHRIIGSVMLDGCDFAPFPPPPTPAAAPAVAQSASDSAQTSEPAAPSSESASAQAPQSSAPAQQTSPVILKQVPFSFTQEAIQTGTTGIVRLSFLINTDGTPSDIRVDQSVGAGLDEEATRALKQFVFSPSANSTGQRYSLNFNFTQLPKQPATASQP